MTESAGSHVPSAQQKNAATKRVFWRPYPCELGCGQGPGCVELLAGYILVVATCAWRPPMLFKNAGG